MTEQTATQTSSAFVPHDVRAPIVGNRSGPLAGLTVAVKDVYDIAGERTGVGSPQWLATHPPAEKHAAAVQLLLDAGATIIGKTICDELVYSITGANAHYGTPANPRAPGRLPGGSSSGSAAATAMGACDFALGGDTGGSVRVPAALCGLYGIRTTLGRFDGTGTQPMAPTFDSFGWFSQGPGLLQLVGQVLLPNVSAPIPVRRLLLASDTWREVDAEVADVSRAFLGRTATLLPRPEEVTLTPDAFDAARAAFRTLQAYEVWQTFGAWVTVNDPPLGPGVRERIAYAATVTEEEATSASAYVMDFRTRWRALVEPGTVVCLPTAPCISPEVDADPDVLDTFRTRTMALTCTAGLAGLPQVTLPVGTVDGCPVGLSFVGWANGDESLLDLAVTLGPYCGG